MDGFSFSSISCSQGGTDAGINNLEDSTLGFDTSLNNKITPSDQAEETRCENITTAISSTIPVNETITNSVISNDKIQSTEENKNSKNEDSVWGPHLSIAKKEVEPKKPKIDKPAVLSRFTAKLFAGANFKIRNPRKSFIRREKSTSDVPSDNSLIDNSVLTDSNQSFSQPEVSLNSGDTIVQEGKDTPAPIEDQNSQFLDLNNSKFKIVNTSSSQKQCQPVSILQKTLLSNMSKPLANRSVDKGWLDRLEKMSSSEVPNSSDSGIDLGDSSVVSGDPRSSPAPTNQDSDDDVVCDSDSEDEKSRSFSSFSRFCRTSSVSRLSLNASNSDLKRTSSSLSYFTRVNSDSKILQLDKRDIKQTDGEIEVSECKKLKMDCSVVGDTVTGKDVFVATDIPAKEILSKEDRIMHRMAQLVEIQNKLSKPKKDSTPKSKEEKQKEIFEKKITSGKANENFVKINIKKKTYVRGKKTMTFQKYKKQKWKDMKKSSSYGGEGSSVYKCFKCGDIGHYAKNCMKACDQLLPLEDVEEQEESPFPTLQEAEEMALEASKKLVVKRFANELPANIVSENADLCLAPPQPVNSDDIERLLTKQEPIFNLSEDGSVIDTPLAVLDALLQFGHQTWRPGQEAAVMRVLSGLSTLVTLSTGSGKSLCYQLPAFLYHKMQGRITLVVSPLVSLMEDQVVCGSPCLRVACLHTAQTPAVRNAVMDQLRSNSLHALLVSPEALSQGDRISELLRCMPPVAFACIDEAHCISQWSHNFRPSYLTLCQVLREKFGVKTFLGLTATATHATITSVCEALELTDITNGVIRDTPLPNNLQLTVSRDRQRDQALVALLQGERFSQCRSIIVYCTRRDECQRLAAYIRTSLQDVSKEDGKAKRGKLSWNAEAYHAGLTAARRRAVQKAFMSGKTRIVVATVAFGMGINKQDIQGIVHYNMPSSYERYVQEVGRAGRDGEIAHCHLFLNTQGGDLSELRRFIYADSVERHNIRRLLQRVFVPCDCGETCTGHEVAFSVAETVTALDLPEENIDTLLCYLELYARARVRVCNRAYTKCRILSYKGPKLIRQAAKECPPLAVAVAMEAQKGVSMDKMTKLEFPIFPVASVIQWDSGVVKQQLKALEWTKVDGQPRKSGLTVELFDLGFRVIAVGNLTGDQLDATLGSLTDRVDTQETQALRQLQATFTTLSQVSHQTVDECMDKVDDKRCEELKSNIRQYFTSDSFLDNFQLPEVSLSNEDQIVADVRNLINSYIDVTFTGRAVARIFHGIASPNFPAQQWGRCRYWRAHLHEDFKLIARLATRELIKMR
ncbi:ATP-dependent DNA helicase Q4-like [Macrosteles quadrilineatus]|uniref:ATP-dependent DNA helicase Q4-like n=1 Tax=Macrosteles quadrilineatus TaxID=74068 RepID=UPI0023E2D40F|nr:ATP-dependent DNA helicase Q4-like [Macrosteles quadrilineatus]